MAQVPDMREIGEQIGQRLTGLENPTASATTGAAGSSAQVTVSKQSDGKTKFAFTIPRGDKGEKGATGATGATGPAGTTKWAGITDKPSCFIDKGISMGRLP